MLSFDDVNAVLRYDPATGDLWWKVPGKGRVLSRPAGNLAPNGYRYVRVSGKLELAHRLAWLLMKGEWPDDEIDHENTNSADNRWLNLRPADSSKNKCNTRISSRNSTGFKGVSRTENGRWRASIAINGVSKSLGRFDSPEAAHAAYVAAAERLHGEFARAA